MGGNFQENKADEVTFLQTRKSDSSCFTSFKADWSQPIIQGLRFMDGENLKPQLLEAIFTYRYHMGFLSCLYLGGPAQNSPMWKKQKKKTALANVDHYLLPVDMNFSCTKKKKKDLIFSSMTTECFFPSAFYSGI